MQNPRLGMTLQILKVGTTHSCSESKEANPASGTTIEAHNSEIQTMKEVHE